MFFQKLISPEVTSSNIVRIGNNMPAFMGRNDVYYTVSAFCDYNGICYQDNHNYLSFGPAINGLTGSSYWGFNSPNYPLTAKEAMVIDAKLDDGAPLTGDITAATNWGNNPPVTVGSNCVSAASQYNPAYFDSKVCNLYMKLGF